MEDLSKGSYTINDLGTDLEARHEVYFTLRFTMYAIWNTNCTYSIINLFDGTQSPYFKTLDGIINYNLYNELSLKDTWDNFHFRFIYSNIPF